MAMTVSMGPPADGPILEGDCWVIQSPGCIKAAFRWPSWMQRVHEAHGRSNANNSPYRNPNRTADRENHNHEYNMAKSTTTVPSPPLFGSSPISKGPEIRFNLGSSPPHGPIVHPVNRLLSRLPGIVPPSSNALSPFVPRKGASAMVPGCGSVPSPG